MVTAAVNHNLTESARDLPALHLTVQLGARVDGARNDVCYGADSEQIESGDTENGDIDIGDIDNHFACSRAVNH